MLASRLLAVQVSPESRQSVLKDVLTVYGGSGKSIIFTQTKREADAVTAAISSTHPCEVRAAAAPSRRLCADQRAHHCSGSFPSRRHQLKCDTRV